MTPNILVVDDSEAVRRVMAAILERAGYRVMTAATYPEAKSLASSEQFDLMLIDIRLGEYNGLQLALADHLNGRRRAVILMSGYHDPVLVKEARNLGAEFLVKPIEPRHLIATIANMLALRLAPE